MIKTLAVSGCSFTMGGGLDNPNYHKLFESNALNEDGKTWNTKISGRDGRKFSYHNNYPYYLSKLLKVDKFYNFAIGGGGLFRTTQSLYTFLKKYDGNPSELQIIYQIPSSNRMEIPQNWEDSTKGGGFGNAGGSAVIFKSIMNNQTSCEHLKMWVKYFQNSATEWLRTLIELDKLNEMCKLRGIDLILIDWMKEFTSQRGYKRSMISELMQVQEQYLRLKQHERLDFGVKTLYRQICDNWFDESLIDLNPKLPFLDVTEIIDEDSNKIHKVINGKVEVVDHHLDPNGAKLLGNYIFEKKFKEN